MTKVFVVLTAVLSIVASVLFISASAQWGQYKQLAETYQRQRDAALTERDSAIATQAAALAMKDDLLRTKDVMLADLRDETEELANDAAQREAELVRARNDAVAAEAGRTKLQEILDVVTGELKALQKQSQSLLAENVDYQTRISRLNSRVLDLTASNTILTEQLRNLQEKLFASEQRVSELQQQLAAVKPAERGVDVERVVVPTVSGPIRGEIVDVASGYASINIGESSGVVPGMVMMVYRGTSFLGELEISRVLPDESGGRLTTMQGEIRQGDRVAFEQL